MTTRITDRKGNKFQLTGDILTGNTFNIKDYIKTYLDGKWVADVKGWRVNVVKLNALLATPGAQIRIDTDASAQPATPKRMSYADFVRSADDPNSDY